MVVDHHLGLSVCRLPLPLSAYMVGFVSHLVSSTGWLLDSNLYQLCRFNDKLADIATVLKTIFECFLDPMAGFRSKPAIAAIHGPHSLVRLGDKVRFSPIR